MTVDQRVVQTAAGLDGGHPPASSEPTTPAAAGSSPERLSPAELRGALDRFKDELRAAGLRESTIHSYLMGSRLFVRWLVGEYVPGPRRADQAPAAEDSTAGTV